MGKILEAMVDQRKAEGVTSDARKRVKATGELEKPKTVTKTKKKPAKKAVRKGKA